MDYISEESKYLVGIVESFDEIKDYGCILSNVKDKLTPHYNVYEVNSSCFVDKDATKKGCAVIFQLEEQTQENKIINVRSIANCDIAINTAIIEKIINLLSLHDVYRPPKKWYDKPELNLIYRKILETSTIELFPIIAKRLISFDSSKENIPLAILLTELMVYNRPEYEDYYTLRRWDQNFKSNLINLKNATTSNPIISTILWCVYFQTATSMKIFSENFSEFPPYIQVRCVKKIFHLISQDKIHFTAGDIYNLITKSGKPIWLPLEIVFAYLKQREKDSSATLNNNIMLHLLTGREDHAEWFGIRNFLTKCNGRWIAKELPDDKTNWKGNRYFNGIITKDQNHKLRLFIPIKMIDEHGHQMEYNNKYFLRTSKLINITYSSNDYQIEKISDGITYIFDEKYEIELFSIARAFNFKYNGLDNYIDFDRIINNNDYCECRLSTKLDDCYKIAFNWCENKPCFCPPSRYMLDDEWERYTLLDFMRILNIPTDYINNKGKRTIFGHYIILSSFIKSFEKFYEHLICRCCKKIMAPYDLSNFSAHVM